MNSNDAFESVRKKFFWRRVVTLPDGRCVEIALLVRQEDLRPLDAPWWREKQASLIGADLDGNFFLRHCDGSVRYWDHRTNSNLTVAASVKEFALLIKEGEG